LDGGRPEEGARRRGRSSEGAAMADAAVQGRFGRKEGSVGSGKGAEKVAW